MGAEIELKLELPEAAADRLLREPWLGKACEPQKQTSVYFDSPQRQIRERGYTLRVREAGGRFVQTVKSLDNGAGFYQRGEWEYQIETAQPDAERLAHTPLSGIDVATLTPIVRSEVNRTICKLDEDGAEIELAVDRGAVRAGKRKAAISELELELIRGEPAGAVSLARRIAHSVPVKLSVMSKAERGFALADGKLGKVVKAEPLAVRPGMSVAEGFATIVSACLRHFCLNEPLVIEQRLPAALHQARVAMRRLRSALSLFGTAITDPELPRLREELRSFTGELGDARNLDVYLLRELPAGEKASIKERREAAYDRVIAAMDSEPVRMLMLDLVAWSALGAWRGNAAAQRPLEPYARGRIDRLWRRIVQSGKIGHMQEEERHRLRIQIKKLRYALEFMETLYVEHRERQKRFGKTIEDLQEALGHLNDLAVARTLIASDSWLIPGHEEDDEQQLGLIRDAEDSLHQLRRIGPYWRNNS